MKIVILTTKTLHHDYFIEKISSVLSNETHVFYENRKINFPFKTFHNFEEKRKKFEINNFKLNKKKISAKFNICLNINSKTCIKKIKIINPELIIVFGTGKINEEFIKNFKKKIFNLHGGDPSLYRGLDSHLWGIYHNDFKFIVTLHKLKAVLDSGNIIYKECIKDKNIKIWKLRYFTTLKCIKLVSNLIKKLQLKSKYPSIKQKKIGRYYSAMPSSLKEICYRKMETNYGNK